jgi:hypothetical protein
MREAGHNTRNDPFFACFPETSQDCSYDLIRIIDISRYTGRLCPEDAPKTRIGEYSTEFKR